MKGETIVFDLEQNTLYLEKFSQLAQERYGDTAYNIALDLQKVMSQSLPAAESEKLRAINAFFNQNIEFAEDSWIWSQSDYWATPLELIGAQAGDCEDFSIAKYIFLKRLNVSNDRLRLSYVSAKIYIDGSLTSKPHMVLSYYPTPSSADPLVLDNINFEILPASNRKDLTPVYSFNDKSFWVGKSKKPSVSAPPQSKWQSVLARILSDMGE